MFCGKCGSECDEDTVFCPNCGEKVGQELDAPVNAVESSIDQQGKMIGNILRIAIAVVVVVVVVIGVKTIFFSKGYVKVVKKYYKAVENADGKELMSLFPDEYNEYLMDVSDYDDEEEMIEDKDEALEDSWDEAKDSFGEDVAFTYEIQKCKELDEDELKEINEDYKDDFDFEEEVSKGYEVKVRVIMEGEDKKESETQKLNVIKIKGKWYLDPGSI